MGKFIDLTGQKFGKLTAIKIAGKVKVKHGTIIKWLCQCDCGNTRICPTPELRRGKAKHCGCLKVENLVGKRFNKLVVIKRVENSTKGLARWLCQCDCGNLTIVATSPLKNSHIKSCGCLQKEKAGKNLIKHGLTKNKDFYRLMHIRKGMKIRCYSIKSDDYKNYGGRGIKICDEWLNEENGMINFYNWAINNGYKDNLSIDRINVNGNYEPNNCRWITNKEQCNNKRNNHYITYNGETRTMMEWCELFNLKYNTVRYRIKRKNPKELWFYKGKITRSIKKKYIL